MSFAELPRLEMSARIVVQYRRPHRPIVAAEQDRAVHLAGKADPAQPGHRRGRLRSRSRIAANNASRQTSGSCSDQSGRG